MSRFKPTASYTVFLRGLVRARIDSGTPPLELARRLDIPVEVVREIEAGKRPLDFVQTRAWCQAMGVDFTAFVLQVGKDIEANFAGTESPSFENPDALEGDDGDVVVGEKPIVDDPASDDPAPDPLFSEFDELEGGAA